MKFEGQLTDFVVKIKSWARELGFSELRIADVDPGIAEIRLQKWLAFPRGNELHGRARDEAVAAG